MRDTSLTTEDLAIMNAKETLVSIAERPGYAQAMASVSVRTSPAMVSGGLVTGVTFGILVVPAAIYIDATWLRAIVVAAFVLIALLGVMAAVGSTEKFSTSERWPVAVLAKIGDADEPHKLTVLVESGVQHTVTTDASTYALVKPGDVGVAEIRGSAPSYELVGLHRL